MSEVARIETRTGRVVTIVVNPRETRAFAVPFVVKVDGRVWPRRIRSAEQAVETAKWAVLITESADAQREEVAS